MIRKFLDCSTAHVSEATAKWLDEQGRTAAAVESDDDTLPMLRIARFDGTGWIFYSGHMGDAWTDDDNPSIPPEIKLLCAEAQRRQCDYVMLDRDADTIPGLPVYEW